MKSIYILLISAVTALHAQTFSKTASINCQSQSCQSAMVDGDTMYASAWSNAGTFTYNGASIGGAVYSTWNDGLGGSCGGTSSNIGVTRLNGIDFSTPSNGSYTTVNCMTSFGTGASNAWPPATSGTCSATHTNGCSWKSTGFISYNGCLYLHVFRQDAGNNAALDGSIVKSCDAGATWANPVHLGSPNANGDAPTGPGSADYPANILFPAIGPTDGSGNIRGRMNFVNFCKDETVSCPSIDNNATYIYAILTNGNFAGGGLMRWTKSTFVNLNPSGISYYKCPGYATTVCDGTSSGSWDSNVANATVIGNMGDGANPHAVWDASKSLYIAVGFNGLNGSIYLDTAPHVWGPWTPGGSGTWNPTPNPTCTGGGCSVFPGIVMPTLEAASSTVTNFDITTDSSDILGSGSVYHYKFSMTVPAASTSGSPIAFTGKVALKGKVHALGGFATSTLALSVVGTSPTQAAFAYTAPNSSPCTVQVSESNTLAPLVHDVDSTLFTGANTDDRAGGLSNGTARIFILGKRAVEAHSGINYSRALQANTTHYYRVACGSAVATGSFSTLNIPIGNTFNEVPPVNPTTGLTVNPTFPTNTSTLVIDPFTGIAAKRATLPLDNTHSGTIPNPTQLYSGGRRTMCGPNLVGPGPGYMCMFPVLGGYSPSVYYYIPSTGEIRFLGKYSPRGGLDPSDSLNIFVGLSASDAGGPFPEFRKSVYTGDFSNQAADHSLDVTTVNLTPGNSWQTMINAYDSSLVGCGNADVQGAYALMECHAAGGQDSYGYMAVIDMGDKLPLGSCSDCMSVIAATKVYANPETRWCAVHSGTMVPSTPLVFMEPHSMDLDHDPAPASAVGLGPYRVSLTAGVSNTDTTFLVSGEPQARWDATEPYLQDAAIGDVFLNRTSGERVLITGKTGSTWTVTRHLGATTATSYSSGAFFEATCANDVNGKWFDRWWSFLTDPTASTALGYLAETISWGGHEDAMPNGRVQEKDVSFGPIMSMLALGGIPLTAQLTTNPTFAGVEGFAFGNTYSDYPSYHQVNASADNLKWFLDEPTYFGASQQGPGATSLGGSLYKYDVGTDWITTLHRKQLTTITSVGRYAAVDISSPATGNVIGTTSADNFKYCVAAAANECRTGSVAGDVYINMPGVISAVCSGTEGPETYTLCLTDLAQGQGAYQFGVTPNTVARPSGFTGVGAGFTRKVSYGFAGIKLLDKLFKSTPDGLWGFLDTKDEATGEEVATYMLKLPPMPTTLDPLDRSTFVRVPVAITTPSGLGIARAAVEFGYVEYGTSTQHYCTSRAEACLATAATVTDATPFYFATTEASATASALSCSTSCTVMLPLLPLRVAYWKVKFYDSGGSFVQDGPSGVAMEGGATVLP